MVYCEQTNKKRVDSSKLIKLGQNHSVNKQADKEEQLEKVERLYKEFFKNL